MIVKQALAVMSRLMINPTLTLKHSLGKAETIFGFQLLYVPGIHGLPKVSSSIQFLSDAFVLMRNSS